jgi:hypothetical protein
VLLLLLIVMLLALARVTTIVLLGPIKGKKISGFRQFSEAFAPQGTKLTGRLVAEEHRSCSTADTVAADTRRTVAALEEDNTTWRDFFFGAAISENEKKYKWPRRGDARQVGRPRLVIKRKKKNRQNNK